MSIKYNPNIAVTKLAEYLQLAVGNRWNYKVMDVEERYVQDDVF